MKPAGVKDHVSVMGSGEEDRNDVIVIGGGIAGMSASLALTSLGHRVTLIEKDDTLGGRAAHLGLMLPQMLHCSEIIGPLVFRVLGDRNIQVMLSGEISSLGRDEGGYFAELDNGRRVSAAAMILATGLDTVPAGLVPEYGHGLRKGVMTLEELEERFASREPLSEDAPRDIVFVQCVGSRTERRGVPYCSALCCANAIKNALLLKREDPGRDVTVLYIDIRTAGKGQEELYREARRSGVRFIRGQPSLVTEREGRLLVCGENTLLRELYELPADLVVLATGLRQPPSNLLLMDELEITEGTAGFPLAFGSRTSEEGVFLAGSVKSPMDMPTAERDARACALDVHEHLGKRATPPSP